ncbi:uncharacterized protein LOC117171186 [Belonocnema kinseyi]|uniref:uncharacterized protein LOC117171186 n=1 Tax=Belonocnema kinseyi TaxID=2817044 RepID=UPI00143CEA62|nr:uncharacterized protein LOC117171186 [Belonocnema kinseyi]
MLLYYLVPALVVILNSIELSLQGITQSRQHFSSIELLPLHYYEEDRRLPLGSKIVEKFSFPRGYLSKDKHGNFYRILPTTLYREAVADAENQIVGYLDFNQELWGIYDNTPRGHFRVKIDKQLKTKKDMDKQEIEIFPEHEIYDISGITRIRKKFVL